MSFHIELQTRDLQLLRALFESRLMTLAHLATLFFDDRMESTKKRLQKLCTAGYLKQRQRRLYQHAIYQLTNRSIYHLQRLGVTDAYRLPQKYNLQRRMQVSELTLRHELEVMDLRVALHRAVESDTDLVLLEASTWPLLSQFELQDEFGDKRVIRPDAFLRLRHGVHNAGRDNAFFVEIDRSTEAIDRLRQRALDYRQFYKEGGLRRWINQNHSSAATYPFRVLYILENTERRNNVTEALLRLSPAVLSFIWLSTREQAMRNPLGKIWVVPKDYRDAIAGTDFDLADDPPAYHYRRRSERETFIDAHLKLRGLL